MHRGRRGCPQGKIPLWKGQEAAPQPPQTNCHAQGSALGPHEISPVVQGKEGVVLGTLGTNPCVGGYQVVIQRAQSQHTRLGRGWQATAVDSGMWGM